MPKAFIFVFWAFAIVVPLAMCAFAVSQIPDVAEVPLHWNSSGEIDRWGTPDELARVYWILGGVMAGSNVLLAFAHIFNDLLYSSGLVHGVSRENAPKVYVALGIVLPVLVCAIVFGISSQVHSVVLA